MVLIIKGFVVPSDTVAIQLNCWDQKVRTIDFKINLGKLLTSICPQRAALPGWQKIILGVFRRMVMNFEIMNPQGQLTGFSHPEPDEGVKR